MKFYLNQVFEYLVPTTSIDNKDEHIQKGLTYEQASALLKEVGPNELKAPTATRRVRILQLSNLGEYQRYEKVEHMEESARRAEFKSVE